MTALSSLADAPAVDSGLGHRVWRATRLHYANPWTVVTLPWIILGIIAIANVLVWTILRATLGDFGPISSGGVYFVPVYFLILAVQTMNLTFPYALGLSATRREYSLGTSLMYVLQSAGFAIGLTILSYLEEWSGGWFLGGQFFTSPGVGSGPLWSRLFVWFGGLLFAFFAGSIAGALYVRWKANGLYLFGLAGLLVTIGLLALIGFTDSWPAVGGWFVQMGVVGAVAWSLLPTALFGIIGYVVLQRATPKS